MEYIIGIDVGTTSVRGALVDKIGNIVEIAVESITTWNPEPDFYEQSSNQIWQSCCRVMKKIISRVSPASIKGIGFDATCSLAVFDIKGKPVSVNKKDIDDQNIILWMDHRAKKEADDINQTKHQILKYVGGHVSLEMVIPKVLWLKRNHSRCWKKAHHYFLLNDFLTWKCTGEEYRSLCSVVCKFNYEALPTGSSGWNKEFFEIIDLIELSEDNWKKIGSNVINPGTLCGKLTLQAAEEFGLLPGTPVAASLIDAHAGSLGVVGCIAENISPQFHKRLALICGTSTCHMWQTPYPVYVPGVWGPYYNAMIPKMWLLEGGQSASGKLIDHIIDTHPATSSIKNNLQNQHISNYLNSLLRKLAEKKQISLDELSNEVHVWPDFHGNRSPLADPTFRGMILGLTLAKDEENLAVLYLAVIQALAYGTRHILQEIERKAGKKSIESIIICGGLCRNDLFVQTHANAMGLPVLIPEQSESILLGAAILGASVAKFYSNIEEAVLHMAGPAKIIKPNLAVTNYHAKKYAVFMEMLNFQNKIKQTMNF
ncbi:hypothetical protein PGB90_005307 [Kerria lacca]